MNRIYLCIDLKTFYASVECVERGLDPFKTKLVVADPSRGKGAICLAISPALKELGIKNRCRLFEIPDNITYITALPRMKKYIEYSANIYAIYLKYIAKEDIHPYSIDEMFMDVTNYLKMYHTSAIKLAQKILDDIYKETGITATVGIGTNLYLTKIALDITAKHSPSHIGILDENKYKETLWHHTPLTDFWQVGSGIQKRLNKLGLYDMYDVSHADPKILYKEFGINAEYLIDHANGIEPTTIADIKKYKPTNNSLSNSQILFEDYPYQSARLVLKEMVEVLSLDLIDKYLIASSVGLVVGYSKDAIPPTGGSRKLIEKTNVFSVLLENVLAIFDQTVDRDYPIRRIGISFGGLLNQDYEQLSLFLSDEDVSKERALEQTMLDIKNKYGKNSILRGMSYQKDATARKRNKLIGGHNGGE